MLSTQLTLAALILGLFAPAFSKPSNEKSKFQIRRRDAQVTVPILLGTASTYTIFASTGISTVAGDVNAGQFVAGDIGVGPIELTAITGFGTVTEASPIVPAFITGNTFGPITTGPQKAAEAVLAAFNSAYTDNVAATVNSNLATNYLDVKAVAGAEGVLPGVYQFVGTLVVNEHIILSGSSTDVYVFQAAGAISTGAGSSVTLGGDLLASNVFWVSATSFTSGVASSWMGMILTGTNVVIAGSLVGGVYSQTEVALHQATISLPVVAASAPPCNLVPNQDAGCDPHGNVNACFPGYGLLFVGDSCNVCSSGFYLDNTQSACLACSIGVAQCESATVADSCNAGYGYDASARTCTQCTGTNGTPDYGNGSGTDACGPCDGFSYLVARICRLCPHESTTATCSHVTGEAFLCKPGAELVTENGSSICNACTAGTFSKYGGSCQPCASGDVSPPGQASCILCTSAKGILGNVAKEQTHPSASTSSQRGIVPGLADAFEKQCPQ